MSILANMLSRVGKSEQDFKPNTHMGKIFRRRGVTRSSELDRVHNLPRRQWEDSQSIHAELTAWLKRPRGTMELRPVQAAALSDLHDFGGLLAPVRVGGGKTLCSLLAAEVVGAKRPLLLIPAKLKRKTQIEIRRYAEHWRFKPPEIVTYEWLGRVQADDEKDEDGEVTKSGFLRRYAPDLIIADEVHKLRGKKSAVTRRVSRYMDEFSPKFVAMSGTITKRSIKDYAHIAEWCLRRVAPVPLTWPVLSEWADALDEKVRPENRLAPGALLLLCNPEEISTIQKDSLGSLRKAYRRRLVETPGVIATSETFVDCSLVISAVELVLGPKIDAAFDHMKMYWETPDGWPISDAVSLWRHAREMACGFCYRWDPYAPQLWLSARKEWCAAVREIIKHKDLDSELQVANAIVQGRVEDPESKRLDKEGRFIGGTVYENWIAIKNTFVPNTVPVWIDDGTLKFCANWMKTHNGIVWVEHVVFGERLAEMTGRPFFHRKGEDNQRRLIDETTPAEGSIIASIASNCEGRNLQAWSENLIVSLPPTGSTFEQLLGREHRDGQLADEVSFDVILACIQQWSGFQQALADSKYIQDSTGQLQKLQYADVDVPSPSEMATRTGARWTA